MKWLFIPILIILNPYNDINYDEILAIEIQAESELQIVEILGDGYREGVKSDEVCFPREGLDYSLRQYFLNFPL